MMVTIGNNKNVTENRDPTRPVFYDIMLVSRQTVSNDTLVPH